MLPRKMAELPFVLQPTWIDHDTSQALDYVMEGEDKYYLEASSFPLSPSLPICGLVICTLAKSRCLHNIYDQHNGVIWV